MTPFVLQVDTEWFQGVMNEYFGRTIPRVMSEEIRVETTHNVETSLLAGDACTFQLCVAMALDTLGYITVNERQSTFW